MGLLLHDSLQEHFAIFGRIAQLEPVLEKAAALLVHTLGCGHKLLLCGNGGSAADSQHIAAELTGRFTTDRNPLAAIALSTDTSALTSIGNDYGFDEIFARQVRAIGRAGDCLIAISTSGNSRNTIRAAECARGSGIHVIGLLGRNGGSMLPVCDIAIVIASETTARIQEAHIFIGHVLCGMIEDGLRLA